MPETDADKVRRIRHIIDDLHARIEEARMRDALLPSLLSVCNQIAAVLGDYPHLTRDPDGTVRRD